MRLVIAREDAYTGDRPNATNEQAHIEARLSRYPGSHDMMPTLLGNTLRAGERRAGERYGLSTVNSWPRLYHVLSETVRRDIEELHTQVDGAARLTISLILAAAGALPVLAPHGWYNGVTVALLVLSWISYRGAVAAASDLNIVLSAAYDLHRFDMLKQLHYDLPKRPREEFLLNHEISAFWADTDVPAPPPVTRYRHQ